MAVGVGAGGRQCPGQSSIRSVLSHHQRLVPGTRNRFCWDASCVTEIIRFGKWIFLATAFWFFALNADKLILGRLVSLSVLGVYGIAFQMSDVPRAVSQCPSR